MSKNHRLIFPLVAYAICFVGLRPLYQHLISSDGIGYLAVTRYLANGNYHDGVNGYWSPLHSWLAIPFFKAGIDQFLTFIVINGLCGGGILIALNSLLQKTSISNGLAITVLFTSVPIILSYAFDFSVDILLCLLLLIYINLIIQKDFFSTSGKNMACGIIGCLCYFAKTYAFLFFIVHFFIVQLILYSQTSVSNRKQLLVRNLTIGIASFLLMAAPWIYILSMRYHIITIGYAGSLNYKWFMELPQLITTPDLVAVPPQPMSCFWENSWYYPSVSTSSIFSSHIFLKQIKLILHNVAESTKILNSVSWFAIAIIFAMGLYAFLKKERVFSLLFSFIIILFAGYLGVHIELRFIMAATFVILVAGVILLNKLFDGLDASKWVRLTGWFFFAVSFLFYPANYLQDMAGQGKPEFALAKELQAKGVKGKFVSGFTGNSTAEELAYLTGNTYCVLTRHQFSYDELIIACKQKHIGYYFFFYKEPWEAEAFKSTILYQTAEREINTSYPALIILKLKN